MHHRRILYPITAAALLVSGCGDSVAEPNAEGTSNKAPRFAAVSDLIAHHNAPFEHRVDVTDPDGDPLTVTAEVLAG